MKWKFGPYLCLIVFMGLIDASKDSCNMTYLKPAFTSLSETVSLVIKANTRDVAECTVERYCLKGIIGNYLPPICFVLKDCFSRPEIPTSQSDKCTPLRNYTVPTHHFMCLVAEVLNSSQTELNDAGCEYATACPLFEKLYLDGATIIPTTIEPTTMRTSKVWSSQTSPRKPLTQQTSNETSTEKKTDCQNKDDFNLKVLLAISSTLAIVLPLAVYFYMRRQRMHNMDWQSGIPSVHSDFLDEPNPSPLLKPYSIEQM
ncbi:uncharacterized protein LOC130932110 [Corythoichthys intestinalis]|uniref:uncharacterized protein LOC130932110 n=1 Tax=Corythoichthys intestinalis TaxID=161448 RepID=UPI0025A56A5F|nr:uncharacterized protein LOC130932110 [Corythoichthys intestinalis]XP_057717497.1 uncharacterized protein LOC130932110 [Corythoichthys intestinalis]